MVQGRSWAHLFQLAGKWKKGIPRQTVYFHLKNNNLILGQFYVLSKTEQRVQIFHVPCPPWCTEFSMVCILHRSVRESQSGNPHLHIIVTQSAQFTLQFTAAVAHRIGLDKCVMRWIYYCSFVHDSCISPSYGLCLFILNPSPGSHQSFYCLHSSTFSIMSNSWTLQYVVFLDRLFFSLISMHLGFLNVFSGLDSSFLFTLSNITLFECITVYLPSQWRTCGFLSSFGNYE